MFTRYAVLPSVLVCLVLAACGQTPLAETPKAPETALGAAAAGSYTTYHWYPGYGRVSLLRTSEGFCWLAGVEGRFDGVYSQTEVFHQQGRWYLSAGDSPNKVDWAGAECVKWSAIKTPNTAQRAQLFSKAHNVTGFQCVQQNTETWWGDAATMLTGVSGNLKRSRVWITHKIDGFKPSTLSAQHCSGDHGWTMFAGGQAHSVFIGAPGTGNLPEFWAPGGKSYNFPHEFSANTYMSTSKTVEMAPTDEALCYLTGIGESPFSYNTGAFNSAGDWVWLYRGKNNAGREVWKLNVSEARESNNTAIHAQAACYRLTQG